MIKKWGRWWVVFGVANVKNRVKMDEF